MDHSLDPSVKGCGDVLLQHGIDYHRAAHSAGQQYEHDFAENLLEGHADCRVLATSSGMSAISTALHYVANQISSSEGSVIVDEGCYHETRFLVETLFRNRFRYLDLTSSEVVATLSALQPALVVFDSTRNSRAISPLPVKEILRAVRHGETYLLIDSTSIVSAGSLLSAAKAEGLIERVFVAHSLAKMHQYGMDLVTGGMLVYSNSLEQSFPTPTTFRTHLGMNITEDSASVLPAPSLHLLEQRAAMLSRNVGLLACALQGACEGLTVCTALCWDSTTQLVPYFNLTLTRGQEASWYRAFIARAMEVCRAQGVALVAGTSFGFDLTRIYLVESLIPTHRPFIRLSPGIETQYEMGLLADALVEAVGEV
jgi:hypothetical protein